MGIALEAIPGRAKYNSIEMYVPPGGA